MTQLATQLTQEDVLSIARQAGISLRLQAWQSGWRGMGESSQAASGDAMLANWDRFFESLSNLAGDKGHSLMKGFAWRRVRWSPRYGYFSLAPHQTMLMRQLSHEYRESRFYQLYQAIQRLESIDLHDPRFETACWAVEDMRLEMKRIGFPV